MVLKIMACATLHMAFSAEKGQVEDVTHHFRGNMTGLDKRIVIFRSKLPFPTGRTSRFT